MYFFGKNKNLTPGQLTAYKQPLINNQFFGTLSVKYGLDNYLIYKNNFTLFNAISDFKNHYKTEILPKGDVLVIPESYVILEHAHEINLGKEVEIPKVLGDIFESLMGAIFIDSEFSFNQVWNVMHRFMKRELKEFIDKLPKQMLSVLHELHPSEKFRYCSSIF